VGKLLGLTDVSLYKLAKKICASLDRLTNPLFQSLYPELTKLWAERDHANFKHLVRRMIYIMGALALATWAIFILFGHQIIAMTAGREFAGAYAVTVWYLLANAIAITALPLAPMILAMGKAHLSFWIQFLPTLVYFPVLFWMINVWGLCGAGYAYIVYHVQRVVLQYFVLRNLFKPGKVSPAVKPEPASVAVKAAGLEEERQD
jgi:O-antigen/teichoic acid export membrane protein